MNAKSKKTDRHTSNLCIAGPTSHSTFVRLDRKDGHLWLVPIECPRRGPGLFPPRFLPALALVGVFLLGWL